MSIFKSTLKPYVVRQINTRQNLLSEVKRPVEFAHYVSSKSPWIRMTSFVNYGPKGNETEDLAKKYILMGGALYNMKSGGYSQRSGVGGAGSVYGGDLGTNQYGIRPMPGIADLNTRSLGAYGSLTEATVKFYAWDVKQLEDLTVLFMRPGYKVLLEWGWSMYLDTSVSGEDYKKKSDPNSLKGSFTNYSIQNMPFNTIDCFNSGITQDGIYDQLDKIRHRYSGNYDGVLGSIKNYQYTLLPNGAYECTVTLISIGDVIDTIRLNDTLGYEESEGGAQTPETTNTGSATPDIKSDFEIIFDEYAKLGPFKSRETSPIITSIDSRINPKDAKYLDPYVYTYKIPGDLTQQVIPQGIFKQGGKRSYFYLQFGYILHILNSLKNVFVSKRQTLFEIEIPSDPDNPNSLSNGLCQASYNVVSVDPSVCLIRNSNATLFTSKEEDPTDKTNVLDVKGFRPNIYKNEAFIVKQIPADLVSNNNNIEEYLYSNTNFGLIGNIYVNILEVISIYKEQSISNNGYVYLGEFISALLSKISYSLGSINDFDKFVTNNKVVIIDKHYTEVGADSAYNNKFKINIAGNNSIVRSHKIESKIFPSQASMIAIAAQSRENISALQTSTYNYINEGLVDRLLGEKTNKREDQEGDKEAEENAKIAKLNSILKLIQYVNNYVIPNNINSDSYASNVSTMNGYLNTLLVEMEGGTNYKAVIPISVNLTVDGLSGLTIGEIFTVDKKVLPRDHKDKSIGFIITKLANQIIGGSWTTNIESQMCVLDQESKQIRTKQNAEKLLKELLNLGERNKLKNIASITYFNILAALTADVLSGRIKVENEYGDLVVRDNSKVLYTRAALAEFVPGGKITLEDILKDLNRSYLRSYPDAKKRNPYDKFFYRDDNLNDAQVATNIIYGMYYYSYMVNEIKSQFDGEFNRIMGKYILGDLTEDSVLKDEAGKTVSTTKVFNLVFSKIDINKAVDMTTGILIPNVPLIGGYAIIPYVK
jgi:hypothetical protein